MGRGGNKENLVNTVDESLLRKDDFLPMRNKEKLEIPEDNIIDSDFLQEKEVNYDYKKDGREPISGSWDTRYYLKTNPELFDNTAKEAFISGQCHSFASILQDRIGGELCAFREYGDEWFHVFIKKDNKYIDASGVYNSFKEFYKQDHNFPKGDIYKHNYLKNITKEEFNRVTTQDGWCKRDATMTTVRNIEKFIEENNL